MLSDTTEFQARIDEIKKQGLYKDERVIFSPQDAVINTREASGVINFCANNYLGLANHPEVIAAAKKALDTHGFGLASVRFICGTQDIHKTLEKTIADFLQTEDAILYSSCFDANAGLFETLLDERDAVISDQLNHASIIDGIRLCKAKRYRYAHNDMSDLEQQLKQSQKSRRRLIATDGVFSMDGEIAKLNEITSLAEKYDALVFVDDSHATGFIGPGGKGSAAFHKVMDKVDIYTSTLGKAMGGGSGGFTASRQIIVDLLRQGSRPYLFSNSVAPAVVGAAIKSFQLIEGADDLRQRLNDNTQLFREHMASAGFDIKPGTHPIVPVMLYDAKLAQEMASELLHVGIYVVGFFYPVVPEGQARIRVQISAAHTQDHLLQAVSAFEKVAKKLDCL